MVKVSVIPDITFRGQVRNMGGDGREIGTEFKELTFMNSPITLDIPDAEAITIPMFKYAIRKRLADTITRVIEENLYKDVGSLIGQEGSPPQLIVISNNYYFGSDDPLEAKREKLKFLQSIITASFTILTTDRMGGNIFFGQERVWDNTAPIYTAIKHSTAFESNNSELTCAYDYLINRYGINKNRVKKYTTAYNTTGKRGEKTTGKELIDYWITLPLQEQKDIYKAWVSANRESFFIRDIVEAGSKVHPLNEEVGLQELDGDLWTTKFMNIDPDYTEKDKEETLTILEIVKWCICADVRISVRDYDNGYYLGYNPADYKHQYHKTQHKPTIILKVEHRHAYFETDSKKLMSAVKMDDRQTLDYDELRQPEKKEKKDTDLPVEYLFDDTLSMDAPPPMTCSGEHAGGDMKFYDWGEYRDDFVNQIDRDDCMRRYAKKIFGKDRFENYTTDDYVKFAKQDNQRIVLYSDKQNLNKVACEMLDKHQTKHDSSFGGLHTIRQLSYGNLTILSRCGMNKRTMKESELDKEKYAKDWEAVYKAYPELKAKSGVEPTPCKIGNAIYNKLNKDPSLSTMNGQLRSVFYNSEIKPQNVDIQPIFYEKPVISFDIKKAYTTALETSKYKWNVYDTISQPVRFTGTINPDWFYLAKAISTDYPVKQGVGLMLYHGSLIRHLKDKVDIKYQIEPKRQLDEDFFVEFVKQVKDECGGVFKKVVSSKSVINNFIGGLKKKDSLCNYHHYLTKDKITINRSLNKGNPPIKVEGSDYWIIPNNWKNTHFQNGQPIRLQVIDMINEQMYLFSKWAEKVFKYPALSIRTDACYIQTKYENDESAGLVIPELLDAGWNDNNDYQFEVEKSLNNEEYNRIRFQVENVPLTKGFKFMPNKWANEFIINHKWSKEYGANLLLNTIISSGGCLLEGQAGRGKSELMNALYEKCAKNRVKYALYKECLRVAGATGLYDKFEAYRKKHPVSVRMFAPTNKAANRVKGKTLNKGLGIPVNDSDEVDDDVEDVSQLTESYTDKIIEKMAGDGYTKDAVDIVVVEEISMVNGDMMGYISYLKQKSPHTKIILCGDMPHQLPPVKEEHRNFQGAYVLKEITNFTRMELLYNFRQGKDTDDLWDVDSINPHKFIPTTKRLTQRNLCKYNLTRKEVIEKIQDTIPNPLVIESKKFADPRGHTQFTKIGIGTPMIARVSKVDEGLAKNDMYNVMTIDGDNIKLVNEEFNELSYTKDTILSDFQSGYCITIHKSQGETYKDEYTIWDWRKLAMDKSLQGRRLRYTAQSRSKKPYDNILYQL